MITKHGRWVCAASVGVLVAGMILGYPTFVVTGVIGLVVLGIELLWVIGGSDLDVKRELPAARATRGDEGLVEYLTFSNPSSRMTTPAYARERIGESEVHINLPRIPGRGDQRRPLPIPTQRRAVIQLGPTSFVRSGPFGLFRVVKSAEGTATFFVHPRQHQVSTFPGSLIPSLDNESSDMSTRGSQVFHSIREYQQGDDPRHIHWRTTARRGGTLHVRQHIDLTRPDIRIVLDTTRREPSAATADAFEELLEVVATLVVQCLRQRIPLRLYTASDAAGVSGNSETDQPKLLDALAAAEMHDSETDLTNLMHLVARGSDRSTVVLATCYLGDDMQALLTEIAYTARGLLVLSTDTVNGHTAAVPCLVGKTAAELCGLWDSLGTGPRER